MVYKIGKWYLYKAKVKRDVELVEPIYFFTRWKPKQGIACELPEGYVVEMNERIGLPRLIHPL